MTSLAIPFRAAVPSRQQWLAGGGAAITALIALAFARHGASAIQPRVGLSFWLAVHLATVIPAVPLGAYVLARRKGDRVHRALGRLWAALMMITALASFGVRTSGHLSWIHLFSVVVLVAVPRAVASAIRGDIRRHVLGMQRTYMGLLGAGLFTFIPGRLLGDWLFG